MTQHFLGSNHRPRRAARRLYGDEQGGTDRQLRETERLRRLDAIFSLANKAQARQLATYNRALLAPLAAGGKEEA